MDTLSLTVVMYTAANAKVHENILTRLFAGITHTHIDLHACTHTHVCSHRHKHTCTHTHQQRLANVFSVVKVT